MIKSTYLYITFIDKIYFRISVVQKNMRIIFMDVFYHNPF